jgi:hypothetical protein
MGCTQAKYNDGGNLPYKLRKDGLDDSPHLQSSSPTSSAGSLTSQPSKSSVGLDVDTSNNRGSCDSLTISPIDTTRPTVLLHCSSYISSPRSQCGDDIFVSHDDDNDGTAGSEVDGIGIRKVVTLTDSCVDLDDLVVSEVSESGPLSTGRVDLEWDNDNDGGSSASYDCVGSSTAGVEDELDGANAEGKQALLDEED